jgi:hypothetical protein
LFQSKIKGGKVKHQLNSLNPAVFNAQGLEKAVRTVIIMKISGM